MASQAGAPDEKGRTLLHNAASAGNSSKVEELLQTADPAAQDAYGQTALILAAEHGDTTTVVLLTSCGGRSVTLADSFGRTPLHWCSRRSDTAAIEVLLDQKVRFGTFLVVFRRP
ncbi:unnamed protein product [Phaeothamnion confervicola]